MASNTANQLAAEIADTGSVFDSFPIELFGFIFENLGVEDLKTCRAVSLIWYIALSQSNILSNQCVAVWHGRTEGTWKFAQQIYALIRRDVRTTGRRFRLKEFNNYQLGLLLGFRTQNAFDQITHLELSKTVLDVEDIYDVLCKCTHVSSLTLEDGVLTDSMPPNSTPGSISHFGVGSILAKVAGQDSPMINPFLRLKELRFHFQDPAATNPRTMAAIAPYCTNLESLGVSIADLGMELDWHLINFSGMLECFVKIVQINSKTLKNVSFDNNCVSKGETDIANLFGNELPRENQDFVFLVFLAALRAFPVSELGTDGLCLTRLNLRFRLIIMTTVPAFRSILLPFLRSQGSLQELSISQIYIPDDDASFNLLLDALPPKCKVFAEGVANLSGPPGLVGPFMGMDDDIFNIWFDDEETEEEDDSDDEPMDGDGGDDVVNVFEALANAFEQIGLQENAGPAGPLPEGGIQQQPPFNAPAAIIPGRSDSFVTLKTGRITLTIYFFLLSSIEPVRIRMLNSGLLEYFQDQP